MKPRTTGPLLRARAQIERRSQHDPECFTRKTRRAALRRAADTI